MRKGVGRLLQWCLGVAMMAGLGATAYASSSYPVRAAAIVVPRLLMQQGPFCQAGLQAFSRVAQAQRQISASRLQAPRLWLQQPQRQIHVPASARRIARIMWVNGPVNKLPEYSIAVERLASAMTLQKAAEVCEQAGMTGTDTQLFCQYTRTEVELAMKTEAELLKKHGLTEKEVYQLYQDAENLSQLRRNAIKANSREGFDELGAKVAEAFAEKKPNSGEEMAELSREFVSATVAWFVRTPVKFAELVGNGLKLAWARYQQHRLEQAHWRQELGKVWRVGQEPPKATASGRNDGTNEAKPQQEPSSIYDI